MGETIRVQHSKDYTVIANAAIRDSRLSFKARGLHHLLLSYPDGWKVSIEHLTAQSAMDGETSVKSGLQELEKLGYLTREQVREKGKIVGYESTIREMPLENPHALKNRRGKPQVEKPQVENLPYNKYLIEKVFKEKVSREESLPAKEDLKKDGVEQISANSDLKKGISGKQINPHEDQGTPAAPLKNVYAQAKNVWDLIDTFLLSPELADAVIPSELSLVYKEKNQWNGWVWPWRSKTMDKTFQNFNPAIVQKIATDLARRDKATPDQKYGHAMATIGMWEKTKGGWQNLVNWCDRPQPTQPASNDTTEPETEIPEYFYKWSADVHLMIYENDFRKCHSLQAFYDKRKDHKAWLVFAKQEHPDWDWSLGQKPIIKF